MQILVSWSGWGLRFCTTNWLAMAVHAAGSCWEYPGARSAVMRKPRGEGSYRGDVSQEEVIKSFDLRTWVQVLPLLFVNGAHWWLPWATVVFIQPYLNIIYILYHSPIWSIQCNSFWYIRRAVQPSLQLILELFITWKGNPLTVIRSISLPPDPAIYFLSLRICYFWTFYLIK